MTSLETRESSLKEQRSIFSFLYSFWAFHHIYGLLFCHFPHFKLYIALLGKWKGQTRNNSQTDIKTLSTKCKIRSQYLCFVNTKVCLFFLNTFFCWYIFKPFCVFLVQARWTLLLIKSQVKGRSKSNYLIILYPFYSLNPTILSIAIKPLASTIPRYKLYTLLPKFQLTQYTNLLTFTHLI